MKVGSANIQDDMDRAEAIRSIIGYDKGNYLMMDANQKWDVQEAIENMKLLSRFKPLWIEEPTNCDDILGHLAIANALKEFSDIGVATGEVANSKIIFKQLIQTKAIAIVKLIPAVLLESVKFYRFIDGSKGKYKSMPACWRSWPV